MQIRQLIVTNVASAMQMNGDAVRAGYTNWSSGVVSVERCPQFVKKMEVQFRTSADRNERARRKRAGLGNARLVLLLINGKVHWWLFVTSPKHGDHPAHKQEKLCDATSKNGRVLMLNFELVKLTRHGHKNRMVTTKSALRWTWRLIDDAYQGWRARIIDDVRNGTPNALDYLTYQLWALPGFSGIRSQIGHLAALYRAEVKRKNRDDAPPLPKKLYYVRRMRITGMTPAQLLAKQPNG